MSNVSFLPNEDLAIACNPSALGSGWEQHTKAVADWRAAVQETVELPDGYAFRFPADNALLMTLAEFVSRERLCCPFFTFQIELPAGGPLWLRLTGPEATKALLQSEFPTK